MNSVSQLIRLRAQIACSQQEINNLKSQLALSEIQLGDFKDLLYSKKTRITNLGDQVQTLQNQLDSFQEQSHKQISNANSKVEAQKVKFQEVLDASYSKYYLKGYCKVKEGGSPEVDEEGSSNFGEDNDGDALILYL